MATYRAYVVCVLVCVVSAAISVKITGTITHYYKFFTADLNVSENINGESWHHIFSVNLDRLVEGDYLPTLTLTNIKATTFAINNISLENVPVFENVSTPTMKITENKIKFVPTNAFNGAVIIHLFLDYNEIQSMSVRSIQPRVAYLYLRCNKLRDFSQDWFVDPSSIHDLDLSGNRIENIQDHAFNRMSHLGNLVLRKNYIKRIGSEAFGPGIRHLYLHFNDIEQLTPSMFGNRNELLFALHIDHNQLTYLPKELFLKIKMEYIYLDGNPWQCECLRHIERWIREQNITRHYRMRPNEPICVVPRNFVNTCIQVVDKELQQTYATGLPPPPVQGCWSPPCKPCSYYGLDYDP